VNIASKMMHGTVLMPHPHDRLVRFLLIILLSVFSGVPVYKASWIF
jgi:hypothetical protein